MKTSQGIVVCIGNAFRGDDGVGIAVAEELKDCPVLVKTSDGEPTRLLDTLDQKDWAILVDAMVSGEPLGTVGRFEYPKDKLPQKHPGFSSHSAGIAEALRLGQALNRLPKRIIVFGIEGKTFNLGEGLSERLRTQIKTIAERIKNECTKCL